MKILFIVSGLGYGGAMKNLVFIANSLADIYDVNILIYENKDILQPVRQEIKLYFTDRHSNKKIIKRIRDIYEIFIRVKKIRPDIIISFLNFPNLYSIIVGKLLSIPVIISERGDPFQRLKTFDHFFDFFFNTANGAVFQTEEALSYFGKKLQAKSTVIANPIIKRTECIKYTVNDSHIISFVGRFEIKQKRQDIMVDAFRIVKKEYPDAKLIFYGTGEDEHIIKQMVHKYELNDSVSFLGYVAKPEREIIKSEVFVMTSDYEGIPNALIEAMMLGMPVISTDCSPGGARLLIHNEKNGLLVAKGNVSAIASAIIRVFSSQELKYTISHNAVDLCNEFAPEVIILKWRKYILNTYNSYHKLHHDTNEL